MEDRCVVCGEVIPEGTLVCPNCQAQYEKVEYTKPDGRWKIDWGMTVFWLFLLLFSLAALYGMICGGVAIIEWLAEVLR